MPTDVEECFPKLLVKVVEEIHKIPWRMHETVEKECRQLLREVGLKIFSNLRRMFPSLDLSAVLRHSERSQEGDASKDVEEASNALVACYTRKIQ